jgi:hypothetical protein
VPGRELAQLGIVGQENVQPAGGKRPPCVATPTSAVFGPKASASSTVGTTGTPSSVSPGARSESRIATTASRRYRSTPRIVLP